MSMSAQKCCVPGCVESGNSHPTLHVFPNPSKDKKRFNDWVFFVDGGIIGMSDEDIYRLRRVCHAHFEEKVCCRNNRISNIAVPTLHMPGSLAVPTFVSVQRQPLRKIQDGSNILPSTSHGQQQLQPIQDPYSLFSEDIQMEPSTSDKSQQKVLKENLDPVASQAKNILASIKEMRSEADPAATHPAPEPTVEKQSKAEKRTDPVASQPKNILASIKEMRSEADPAATHPAPEPTVEKQSKAEKRTGHNTKKIIKKNQIITPVEKRLHDQLIRARIKISKCRNKIKQQSASLKSAHKITSNPALLKAMTSFPTTRKILTLMQFREQGKKNKGRRFSLEEKLLALSIFKRGPKEYRFLRKILILPAPQTLAKLISQANVKPGINPKIFRQLKNTVEKMKKEDRICILLFDEIFLKANISYNERKDKVVGFVTDGKETKPEFADHAQVFMIRGLFKNYKQPVSYTFSAAATSGIQIAKQIKEIITELQEAGLIVVATVCDQGSNNRQAIKLLTQETRGAYLRKGEEPKENRILINEREVVPLYDPPHLLKCVRNNLLTKHLKYTVDNTEKTAKWEHILKLHGENPGYKGVRLIPKLTDNHVLAHKIPKMKVKFASQVFSRTVATNMGYLADKGILPKECKDTADILIFFDNLFDSQNGSYNKKEKKFAKPLLGPVTPKSAHHVEWAEAVKQLKNMQFVNPITGSRDSNVPTLKNWAWTLEGIEVLLKNLETEFNITSVWMRHLNQDPIENFFGLIRSHGCRNTNPTPEKFESAFTTLLINNISSVHAPAGGNCEEDLCESLQVLIVDDSTPADCKNSTTNYDPEYLTNVQIEDLRNKQNDPRIIGALTYISGYFTKNVKKNIFKGCRRCATNMLSTEATEYIKYREYAGRQWLVSPSESVIKCISEIQDVTNAILNKYLPTDSLKEFIKTQLLVFLDFDFLICAEHKEEIISYLINLTTRFFIYNRCKEINKVLSGKRDCENDEDLFETKAKHYFKKCNKRPLKK